MGRLGLSFFTPITAVLVFIVASATLPSMAIDLNCRAALDEIATSLAAVHASGAKKVWLDKQRVYSRPDFIDYPEAGVAKIFSLQQSLIGRTTHIEGRPIPELIHEAAGKSPKELLIDEKADLEAGQRRRNSEKRSAKVEGRPSNGR